MSDVNCNVQNNGKQPDHRAAKGHPIGTTARPGQQKKRLSKLSTRPIHRRVSTRSGKGQWREKFLQALRDMPNVAAACEAACITQPTAYDARKRSLLFAKQWEQALKVSVGRLAKAVFKRARDGVVKRIWMKDAKGRPICVDKVREFSDSLAIFLLKSHDPKTYREPAREAGLSVKTPDGTESKVTFDIGVAAEDVP